MVVLSKIYLEEKYVELSFVSAVFTFLAFTLGLVVGVCYTKNRYNYALGMLKYYKRNFLFKSGDGQLHGRYHITSLDGGLNWFNCERKDGGLIITGPADPELIKSLAAWEELVDYTRKNGAIGSRPLTEKDLSLLAATGFTVGTTGPKPSE